MDTSVLKAVYAERKHACHPLKAVMEASLTGPAASKKSRQSVIDTQQEGGLDYLPVSDEMHENKEPRKGDLI